MSKSVTKIKVDKCGGFPFRKDSIMGDHWCDLAGISDGVFSSWENDEAYKLNYFPKWCPLKDNPVKVSR